jgi:hypothetical protein
LDNNQREPVWWQDVLDENHQIHRFQDFPISVFYS